MSSRSTATSGKHANNNNSIAPSPYELRHLILEYLSHKCYSKTAHAFARDTAVKHLDADGDEIAESSSPQKSNGTRDVGTSEQALSSVELREEVRTHILSGRVDDAMALIEQHFPSVLDTSNSGDPSLYRAKTVSGKIEYVSPTTVNPAHISLNLRILAFIEACRTVPLVYPPTTTPSYEEGPSTPTDAHEYLFTPTDPTDLPHQEALLIRAQKLYAYANTLPNPDDRATYMKELAYVGALLAYKVPEKSPMSKYLSQERREAVADQVNNAILHSLGLPPVSHLEVYARYTVALLDRLHMTKSKLPPSPNRPPWLRLVLPDVDESKSTKPELSIVPPLDLKAFLDVKT